MLGIRKIFITQDAVSEPAVTRLKARFETLPGSPAWEVIEASSQAYAYVNGAADPYKTGKQTLLLTRNRGPFIKGCPGTREYTCCGYKILHWASYCPMDCAYCILQAYFHPPMLQLFVNHSDLWTELEALFATRTLNRIGTGEFTDSLVWEPVADLTPELVTRFAHQSTNILELKTKTVNIDALQDLKHNRKTIIAWSLNSEPVVGDIELGTAPLHKRLQAARRCAEWGYPLAFHFDPLLIHEGWEQAYASTIDSLFTHIDPDQIVWISLGTFRFMPGLKEIIQTRFPAAKLIYGEFIPGMDGKMRYFKPLRIEIYRKIIQWITLRAPQATLYFCMEDDAVWQACLGYTPQERGGLNKILDDSAVRHCVLDTKLSRPTLPLLTISLRP
ncbi:MAG: spore photoproduct lyase family protein [Desulfobacterales bacterium]